LALAKAVSEDTKKNDIYALHSPPYTLAAM
jgi:hypothetical protein